MLITYKKPRGRFFIVGKPGSGPVPPTPTMRHIKVNVSGGNGTMTVDGEQVTLDADNNWEADYQDGTQITLAMTTDSGHSMCCWFDRTNQLWADNGYISYDNPVTITMSGDYTIDTQIDTLYNVTLVGASGQGKVGWRGQTPDYSATKTGMYPSMCEDIYAYPETGYEFVEWQSNDFKLDSPTANPSYVCPNNDGTITAVFQPQVQYYSVSVSAGSNGSVAVNGVQGDYSDSVASGTTLTLAATANNGYQFSQWSDGDSTNPRTLTVTSNVTLTASFQEATPQQPNDEVWYTTSDGKTITPYQLKDVNGNYLTVVSNTYTDGKGVAKMSGDIVGTNNSFASLPNLTSVSLPSSLTTIGDSCFTSCTNLTSIDIPSNLTSIGTSAFTNCRSLTTVTIPNSVTSIGNSAFNNCRSLVSVTIPNNVTVLNKSLFGGCSSLTSVVIGESVASFGMYVFYDCTSLTSITFTSTTIVPGLSPFQTDDTFYHVPSGGTVYGQPGLKYSYIMNYLSNWTLVQ